MRRPGAPYAALLALAAVWGRSGVASGQQPPPWLPPPPLEPTPPPAPPPPRRPSRALMPPMLTRPLSLPTGMVLLQWGTGYATSSIGRSFSDRSSLGTSMDLSAGLGRGFQIEAGTGLRIGDLVAGDRYGRVWRDEVFQTGNRFVGNPWVKLRWSFRDGEARAFRAGVEALVMAPLASGTAWSVGLGVPLQLALPQASLRIEGGVFMQFVLSDGSSTRNVFYVPVRVLFSPVWWFGLGLVTGVQVGNVFADDATEPRVQAGLTARFQAGHYIELAAQWMLPTASPFGTDAMGFGLSITHRVH